MGGGGGGELFEYYKRGMRLKIVENTAIVLIPL